MINGIFIINTDGDILAQKSFLASTQNWNPEIFYRHAVKKSSTTILSPCTKIEEMYYIHASEGEVYAVAALETPHIASFLMVESLNRFTKECTDLIGDLTSKNIMNHIAVVYELIIKTFGLCQPGIVSKNAINECKQLAATEEGKAFDFIPDNLFGVRTAKENRYVKPGEASKAPLASQKDAVDEVFLDMIEHLTAVINPDGQLFNIQLNGEMNSKSYLNSPVKLHINLSENIVDASNSDRQSGKVNVTAKRFHSPVDSDDMKSNFPSFTHLSHPGLNHILNYQVDTSETMLPFTMYHNFTKTQKGPMTELLLCCKIFCALPAGVCATKWSSTLPLPSKLHSLRAASSLQSVTFSEDTERKFLTINTPIFPSQSHHSVTITLLLSEVLPYMKFQMPFLNVSFEIPDMCISSMNIHSLKVHNVATNSSKSIGRWVRRSTRCKDFEFQLRDWFG